MNSYQPRSFCCWLFFANLTGAVAPAPLFVLFLFVFSVKQHSNRGRCLVCSQCLQQHHSPFHRLTITDLFTLSTLPHTTTQLWFCKPATKLVLIRRARTDLKSMYLHRSHHTADEIMDFRAFRGTVHTT